MQRNKRGEEINAAAYAAFIVDWLLRQPIPRGGNGQGRLDTAVQQHYKPLWGPSDKKPTESGCPKWRNGVAWAKVILGKDTDGEPTLLIAKGAGPHGDAPKKTGVAEVAFRRSA